MAGVIKLDTSLKRVGVTRGRETGLALRRCKVILLILPTPVPRGETFVHFTIRA